MKTILVCGLGRCGTSLAMQMLNRGGIPTVGRWPAFEEFCASDPGVGPFLASLRGSGRAVKLIDPHRCGLRAEDLSNTDVIWMRRDFREQAKSQVKFLRLVAGMVVPKESWKNMARGLEEDHVYCFQLFHRIGVTPKALWFEHLLLNPQKAAQEMAEAIGRPMDLGAMEDAVIRRSALCARGIEIEERLVAATMNQAIQDALFRAELCIADHEDYYLLREAGYPCAPDEPEILDLLFLCFLGALNIAWIFCLGYGLAWLARRFG